MTVLGEAFIEVRGDVRPFIKDLDRQIQAAAKTAEKRISEALGDGLKAGGAKADEEGEKLGQRVGRGVGRGARKDRGWLFDITSMIGNALDDGLSALPAEAKAAIVLGMVSAVPLVSAALAGAVAAGLGGGLAVLGAVAASQFEEVRAEAALTGELARNVLLSAAEPFALAAVRALERIQVGVLELDDRLNSIAATSAQFLEPLAQGAINAFDFLTESIDAVDDELGPFVEALSDGLQLLGTAAGDALQILVDTGKEGEEGLNDLFYAVAGLIVGTARLLAFFTEVYGVIRDIVKTVPFLSPILAMFISESEKAADATNALSDSEDLLTDSTNATVAATKQQEKALKEAAKAVDEARDATFALIDTNIRFEESIDNLTEALQSNGNVLTAETREGRDNLRRFSDAIKDAQQAAEARYQSGELNAQRARELYQQEVQEILGIARSFGITEEALRGVFGRALDLVNLPAPSTGWLATLAKEAAKTAEALERAARAKQKLGSGGVGSGGRATEFGDGAIVQSPTEAIVGDGGPEVIIPLTKPGRAAQLVAQSGLDRILGGATTLVQVFLGTEQLDQRMYRVVAANNMNLSNSLAFGARGL